eukprot:4189122-Prorocentrum_lima.AAC.1
MKVQFVDVAKFDKWTTIRTALTKEPRLCMASDWVSCIGGLKTGVGNTRFGTCSTRGASLDALQPTLQAKASTRSTN